MPQLNLNFIDIPIPETCLWEQFDDEQKRIVIETLTRLLVKLAQANNQQEQIQKEQNKTSDSPAPALTNAPASRD
jgi:phenylpyruvate tautomerase PptA (4-oxalocrotonate tautomerase family)